MKLFIDQFRDKLPKATQKCPIEGQIMIDNLPLHNKMFYIFPSGNYKITVRITDDVGDLVLLMILEIVFSN